MAAVSLKPSSKGVTALVVVAVLILFGCVLAYVAAAGKIKTESAEMDAKEKQVRDSAQIAQKLEASRLAYLDAEARVRFLESTVSTQDYIPTLLRQIEHLGKSVHLRVVGVRPIPKDVAPVQRSIASGKQASEGNVQAAEKTKPEDQAAAPKPEEKPYDELKIHLEVEGKYMNALDFLYKLTVFPKIIAVNSMEMLPAKVSPLASPRLSIKMDVTALVLKGSGDVPKPEVKPAAIPPGRAVSQRPASTGGTRNEAG